MMPDSASENRLSIRKILPATREEVYDSVAVRLLEPLRCEDRDSHAFDLSCHDDLRFDGQRSVRNRMKPQQDGYHFSARRAGGRFP